MHGLLGKGDDSGTRSTTVNPVGGRGMLRSRQQAPPDTPATSAYRLLIRDIQRYLDAFSRARLDEHEVGLTRRLFTELWQLVDKRAVDELERPYGQGKAERTRMQCSMPDVETLALSDAEFRGRVVIGDFFLGVNGAAHGGAVAHVFDEVLGRMSAGKTRDASRTAYLNTSFRAITPVNTALDVHAYVVRIDGRKRFLRAEIWNGDRLCAEADALFVALRCGQP